MGLRSQHITKRTRTSTLRNINRISTKLTTTNQGQPRRMPITLQSIPRHNTTIKPNNSSHLRITQQLRRHPKLTHTLQTPTQRQRHRHRRSQNSRRTSSRRRLPTTTTKVKYHKRNKVLPKKYKLTITASHPPSRRRPSRNSNHHRHPPLRHMSTVLFK